MKLDEFGYLVDGLIRAIYGNQPDGTRRTVFQRVALEEALWSYGEDKILDLVRAGLTTEQIRQIGFASYRLRYEADPGSTSGHGYPLDKMLALAAVEAIEGEHRVLLRTRRRSRPTQRDS